MSTRPGVNSSSATLRSDEGPAARTWHRHWFRWAGEAPFGNGSLYRCRCGVVRPGL